MSGQAERADELRAQPVTNAVRGLILAAALVTAAYAALGVAAALALAGLARTQEVAHLRTLGLTSPPDAPADGRRARADDAGRLPARRARSGSRCSASCATGLGLAGLVGSPVDVPLVLDPLPLLLILVAMTVVVGVGLLLGVTLQRRVAPTAALRGRFE